MNQFNPGFRQWMPHWTISAWATDLLMGDFFHLTCPFLFILDTVAYFPVLRGRHFFDALQKIRDTTQLFLDVFTEEKKPADGGSGGEEILSMYVRPVKVWRRETEALLQPYAASLADKGDRDQTSVSSVQLREKLELAGCIFHTTSDTEVISYLVTQERLVSSSIEEALERTMGRIEGAYSLILMSPSKLLAARDPHGFRPLCMGEKLDGAIIFASESCALDAVGARFVRDILPGEIVAAGPEGIRSIRTHCGAMPRSLCVFEYIYFARPDSVLEGCPVNRWRQEAGRRLAKTHPVDADVVVGVPDSGLDAAIGYADASGIPYRIGLVKNKYIARTFIAPSQEQRERMVRLKLNPVREAVQGKRVVLVDDSIVRGTTSAQLAGLVREAGAAEVHLRICAPPFLHPCYYGTDIDSEENLIAVNHTVEETAKIIGVDSLGYLSVEDAGRIYTPGEGQGVGRIYTPGDRQEAGRSYTCGRGQEAGRIDTSGGEQDADGIDLCGGGLCTACFDGRYPTAVPSVSSKNRFELPIGG